MMRKTGGEVTNMYCSNCGGSIQPGQRFCSQCGQPIVPASSAATGASDIASQASAPTLPEIMPTADDRYTGVVRPSPVAKHLQILGILWIVVSLLRVIPALGMMAFGSMGLPFLPMTSAVRGFIMPIVGALGVVFAAMAAVGIVAGWGLLERRPWARTLTIVLGCLKLLDFPLGTALGIYTLWVLASAGADSDYQRLARAGGVSGQ
jgi:zinc-ribbon domain